MAEYIQSRTGAPLNTDNYSMFTDQNSLVNNPQFRSAYSSGGNPQGETSDFNQANNYGTQQPAKEKMFDPATAQAAAYGAQSGGIAGALTSGGVTSLLANGASTGNVAAIGGGLILSQIEAAQKAKAAAEQEHMANQKATMDKTRQAYASMANQRYGV